MKNRQFISLIILLVIVFALTALVMKFYTPQDKNINSEEVQTLRERQEIQILLGQAYFLMSNANYSHAESALNRLFEKSPNNILALQMLGQIYFNTERFIEAENVFRKLITLNPDDASCYNNLGQSLAAKKDFKNAIIYLKRALEISPDVIMPYFNLAELYLKIGNKNEAINTLKIAFDVARKNRLLILNLDAFRELETEIEYRNLVADFVEAQLKLAPIESKEGAIDEQN